MMTSALNATIAGLQAEVASLREALAAAEDLNQVLVDEIEFLRDELAYSQEVYDDPTGDNGFGYDPVPFDDEDDSDLDLTGIDDGRNEFR
jgi:hypothetical protein